MKIVIYLIEDNPADVRKITDDLNSCACEKYNTAEYKLEFRALEGTNRQSYAGQEWNFYGPEILETIKEKFSEEAEQGNKMGLLLDVLLTKEDMDNSLSAYYPTASIARDIYFRFYEQMPIYIITSLLMFGTQSEIIMGVDLSDSYIAKEEIDSPYDDVIAMFDKYRTWEKY